jgi:hypothetical protein
MAVSEAVSNVVLHGYRDDPAPGVVEVDADLTDEELLIVVADHGAGFSPRSDSPGAGLGLSLIKAMADDVQVRRRRPRGTELRVKFKLHAPRSPKVDAAIQRHAQSMDKLVRLRRARQDALRVGDKASTNEPKRT